MTARSSQYASHPAFLKRLVSTTCTNDVALAACLRLLTFQSHKARNTREEVLLLIPLSVNETRPMSKNETSN